MKKMWIGLLLVFIVGCVTVKIPKYLSSESPYKQKFNTNFDVTFTATIQALKELGWKVSDTANPSSFEQNSVGEETKQMLIFTEMRQTPLIIFSRYMSINLYVLPTDSGTEIEIRYMSVTPVFFTTLKSFKNDDVVNRIFGRISKIIVP